MKKLQNLPDCACPCDVTTALNTLIDDYNERKALIDLDVRQGDVDPGCVKPGCPKADPIAQFDAATKPTLDETLAERHRCQWPNDAQVRAATAKSKGREIAELWLFKTQFGWSDEEEHALAVDIDRAIAAERDRCAGIVLARATAWRDQWLVRSVLTSVADEVRPE
jgi:hypothetical protein